MSKKTYFKQCHLKKQFVDGSYQTIVSWMPEKYAIKGKYLKLRRETSDGVSGCLRSGPEYTEWDDGWQVIYVSSGRKPKEQALIDSRLWLEHRKGTDI